MFRGVISYMILVLHNDIGIVNGLSNAEWLKDLFCLVSLT